MVTELYTEIVAALSAASEQSIMRPLCEKLSIAGGGKSVGSSNIQHSSG